MTGTDLRDRLREADALLAQDLSRCWAIAEHEWLPAVKPNLGSSNSCPHLWNVERHLGQVVQACETVPGAARGGKLTPAEVFVLLAAVLFHDYGKTQRHHQGVVGHGIDWLLPRHCGALGIPSQEIAKSLGRICAFHEPTPECRRAELRRRLSTRFVDPYGRIRESLIAALLTLADHMDATFGRTLPYYVEADDEIDAVGRFRRAILGVYADPVMRVVRTVLAPEAAAANGDAGKTREIPQVPRYVVCINDARLSEWQQMLPSGRLGGDTLDDLHNPGFIAANRAMVISEVERLLEQVVNSPAAENPTLRQLRLWATSRPRGLLSGARLLQRFMALDLLRLERIAPKEVQAHPDSGVTIDDPTPIVLGNLRENCEMLWEVRGMLAEWGVHLGAWVVERDEHIYNPDGDETYEPVFDPEYLCRIVDGMWKLSGRVFGVSQFSYADLGAHVGDPNTDRVMSAVRRIGIVTRREALLPAWDMLNTTGRADPTAGSREGALPRRHSAVVWGEAHWEWAVAREGGSCVYVSRARVEECIRRLQGPSVDRCLPGEVHDGQP